MPVLIGAGISAGASIINNTVTNLMGNPLRKAQIDSLNLQGRISQLNAQQQQQLALQLQQAQTDNEKMQLLEDAVSQIDVATVSGNASILSASVSNQSKNAMTTAFIVFGGIILLLGAAYLLTKD